jgi:hypothetical protein
MEVDAEASSMLLASQGHLFRTQQQQQGRAAGGKRSATHAPRMVVDQVPLSVRRRRRRRDRRFRRPGFIGAFGVLVARLCRSRHAVGIIAIKLELHPPPLSGQQHGAYRPRPRASCARFDGFGRGGRVRRAGAPRGIFSFSGEATAGPAAAACVRPSMHASVCGDCACAIQGGGGRM